VTLAAPNVIVVDDACTVTVRAGIPCEPIPEGVNLAKRGGASGAGRWRWWIARWNPAHYRYSDYLDLPGDKRARNGDAPATFEARLVPGGRYVIGIGAARYDVVVPHDVTEGWTLVVRPLDLGTAATCWIDAAGAEVAPF